MRIELLKHKNYIFLPHSSKFSFCIDDRASTAGLPQRQHSFDDLICEFRRMASFHLAVIDPMQQFDPI